MNHIYRNNLNTLEIINPELKEKIISSIENKKIEYIDKPIPNIRFDNKTIHSKKNPYFEAEKLIKNINIKKVKETIFLFLGMGIGYHIKMFLEKYGHLIDKKQVIVIENSLEIFKTIIEKLDISFLKKTTIFINEELAVINNYFENINTINFGGYRIIKLRGAISVSPQYYLSIETSFKNILSSKLSDMLTRFSFETLWIRNIVENIPNLHYSNPINSLKKTGKGYATFVIGAGPSLSNQLKTIKSLSSRIFTISVDTALPTLLKYNIVPDIVVTLDGQFHSLYDFTFLFINKYIKKPILVYDILAYPKIISKFRFNSYFTSSLNIVKDQKGNEAFVDNPFVYYIKEKILPFDGLLCGGSVLTTAIELAIYMDFTKIILVGADLSYTQYKTHSNSSPLYNSFLSHSNRLSSIITKNVNNIVNRKLSKASGLRSKKVYTDYVLMSYRDWIENQTKYTGKIINSTDDGINISNLNYTDLKDIQNSIRDTVKPQIIKELEPINIEVLKSFLFKLNNDINYLKELIEQKDFTYERLWQIFPYFHNIIVESKKIFKNDKNMERYFYNFSLFFRKVIDKTLYRLNREATLEILKQG